LYYGDEVGMWGADDPDCRKPMVWSDLRYAPEKCLPSGGERAPDPVSVDREQWRFFRDWIRFRRDHPALRRGDYRTLTIANHPGVLAFERRWQRERIIALFNSQGTPVRINPSDLGIEDLRRWKVEPAIPSNFRTIEIPANHYRILLPR
jgi:glycosidase